MFRELRFTVLFSIRNRIFLMYFFIRKITNRRSNFPAKMDIYSNQKNIILFSNRRKSSGNMLLALFKFFKEFLFLRVFIIKFIFINLTNKTNCLTFFVNILFLFIATVSVSPHQFFNVLQIFKYTNKITLLK